MNPALEKALPKLSSGRLRNTKKDTPMARARASTESSRDQSRCSVSWAVAGPEE